MNTQLLSRYELIPTLIKATSFEVVFIKKNGKQRTMKCLFESTRYIEQGILTVFDLVKQQYRSVNFKTLSQIIVDDLVYQATFKGKFMFLCNRKEKLLEEIGDIIGDDISILNSWRYEELSDLQDELEQITQTYDLEAIKALFIYTYETGTTDFDMEMILDVLQGNLEFIPLACLEDAAKYQLFSIALPTPDYVNPSYIDYQFSVEDIEEYYYESPYGLIQTKKL